ncbi:hypothetical protein [Pacificoceanicola onchidii]|uniref:hypothetical protein n=1 Tax=Pacificoceanicola onchidii TaxID=2562685 RepID=UPI001456157A|nr:hypothetical protein [Pacificoceanicola onchidii]
MAKPFLMRTNRDGSRDISWRVWVLVWVLPVCMIGGGVVELLLQNWTLSQGVRVTGTVERVYEWETNIPTFLSDATHVYAPVFRYTQPDGRETGGSSNMSDPSLNLEVGSTHEIVIFPNQDRDVMVPGPHNYTAGWIVLKLGFLLVLPSLLLSLLLWRWKARGLRA